jgi:hypothetical protein
MTFTEKRNPSNRALTAIIDAGLSMRRHRGRQYAVEFLMCQGVAQTTISRALNGPARRGAHQHGAAFLQR